MNKSLRTQAEIMASWVGRESKPVVSICCITYNQELYIEDALVGFLNQRTEFPIEILVHDDASTDKTASIIREYERQYPELIKPIYQTENKYSKGHAINISFNFDRAKGDYIAVCEGDDYWISPDKLSIQYAALQEYSDVAFCIHKSQQINVASGDSTQHTNHGDSARIFGVNEVLMFMGQFAATSSYFFRKQAYTDYQEWFAGKKLPFGDFFIETIVGRAGILYLPFNLSTYRRNVDGSHTARKKKLGAEDIKSHYAQVISLVGTLSQFDWICSQSLAYRLNKLNFACAKKLLCLGDYLGFKEQIKNVRGHETLSEFFLVLASKNYPFLAIYLGIEKMDKIMRSLCRKMMLRLKNGNKSE